LIDRIVEECEEFAFEGVSSHPPPRCRIARARARWRSRG
jgi:hypothetical protein